MAELSLEVKNSVSHRGKAARKVPSVLARLGLYDWAI
jgi:inosine/xanthosine triphosphate pyrophosphatase family protein